MDTSIIKLRLKQMEDALCSPEFELLIQHLNTEDGIIIEWGDPSANKMSVMLSRLSKADVSSGAIERFFEALTDNKYILRNPDKVLSEFMSCAARNMPLLDDDLKAKVKKLAPSAIQLQNMREDNDRPTGWSISYDDLLKYVEIYVIGHWLSTLDEMSRMK